MLNSPENHENAKHIQSPPFCQGFCGRIAFRLFRRIFPGGAAPALSRATVAAARQREIHAPNLRRAGPVQHTRTNAFMKSGPARSRRAAVTPSPTHPSLCVATFLRVTEPGNCLFSEKGLAICKKQ
jgi:hypothetical protein